MAETRAKNITQEQLIAGIKASTASGSNIRYGFILGAGASVTSKIPSGAELAAKWYKKIKQQILADELRKWEKSIDGFSKNSLAESYTKIFEKRFEANREEGIQEIQSYMDAAVPSIGYSFLAQILNETPNKFVITTNFDTMTEDALFEFKKAKPLVLGHELLSSYVNHMNLSRPTIMKLHRDFLLNPLNEEYEIETLDAQWQESLRPVLKNNAMIVLGYGGNDNSLMNYLKNINIEERKPLYWCYRDKSEISKKALDVLTQKDYVVQIRGFDEFMLILYNALEFNNPLIDKEEIEKSQIVINAIGYANRYIKQLKTLSNSELTLKEQRAIEKLLAYDKLYDLDEDGNNMYRIASMHSAKEKLLYTYFTMNVIFST